MLAFKKQHPRCCSVLKNARNTWCIPSILGYLSLFFALMYLTKLMPENSARIPTAAYVQRIICLYLRH